MGEENPEMARHATTRIEDTELKLNASEELLGQRDDDARRASHVAESVLVLVLGHLADELGAVGAQASDSVVDDDADVIQSSSCPSCNRGRARRFRPTVLATWTWLAEETQGDESAAKLQEG